MANEIYDSTWWGNTIDTASSIGTSTEMIQGQFNLTKIGDELVTNGNFVTDLSGWTLSLDTPPVWDNGMMKMTSDGITFSRADQSFSTEIGAKYKFKIDKLVNNQNITIKIGNGIGNGNVLNQILSSVSEYTFTITAISTTTYIRVEDGSGTNGGYVSNISVQQARATTVEASKCLADTIHRIGLQDIQN